MRTGCWKFCRGAFSRGAFSRGAFSRGGGAVLFRPPPITGGALSRVLGRLFSNVRQPPPFELLFTIPFEPAAPPLWALGATPPLAAPPLTVRQPPVFGLLFPPRVTAGCELRWFAA